MLLSQSWMKRCSLFGVWLIISGLYSCSLKDSEFKQQRTNSTVFDAIVSQQSDLQQRLRLLAKASLFFLSEDRIWHKAAPLIGSGIKLADLLTADPQWQQQLRNYFKGQGANSAEIADFVSWQDSFQIAGVWFYPAINNRISGSGRPKISFAAQLFVPFQMGSTQTSYPAYELTDNGLTEETPISTYEANQLPTLQVYFTYELPPGLTLLQQNALHKLLRWVGSSCGCFEGVSIPMPAAGTAFIGTTNIHTNCPPPPADCIGTDRNDQYPHQ
jgi:hypothetical protein